MRSPQRSEVEEEPATTKSGRAGGADKSGKTAKPAKAKKLAKAAKTGKAAKPGTTAKKAAANTGRGDSAAHASTSKSAAKAAGPGSTPPRATALTTSARDRPRVTAQFAERLAERRAAVRRLRWRTIALVATGVLVLALLAYVVLFSSLLALRSGEIEVTGTNQIVSDEEVLAIVTPTDGTPLARLNTAGLAEELTTIVGVREAHLERDWPHGLQVSIEPRVPVAAVADGDEFAVLDGDGVVLSREAEPAEDLPLVDVPLGEEGTAASLTAVLEVLDALPEDLLAEVVAASALSPNQVSFELPDEVEVFWGSSAENPLKAQVLETLRQVEATGYDVSAPRAPITNGEPEDE